MSGALDTLEGWLAGSGIGVWLDEGGTLLVLVFCALALLVVALAAAFKVMVRLAVALVAGGVFAGLAWAFMVVVGPEQGLVIDRGTAWAIAGGVGLVASLVGFAASDAG